MLLDPSVLAAQADRLEEIEKASMRLVAQAISDFREDAIEIYRRESDLHADIGEDITREALDRMGVSRIDKRLFGKMDYKRARYVFHPDYALRQALFVDSKAERGGPGVARIQTAQTSMRIRLIARGTAVDEQGTMPFFRDGFLTTTIFVKYQYELAGEGDASESSMTDGDNEDPRTRRGSELVAIILAAIPNGMLQVRYNPTPEDGIWNVGPHSPARGESFRVRLAFDKLEAKKRWRVQRIPMPPAEFTWSE
jgi:hypothetical protein